MAPELSTEISSISWISPIWQPRGQFICLIPDRIVPLCRRPEAANIGIRSEVEAPFRCCNFLIVILLHAFFVQRLPLHVSECMLAGYCWAASNALDQYSRDPYPVCLPWKSNPCITKWSTLQGAAVGALWFFCGECLGGGVNSHNTARGGTGELPARSPSGRCRAKPWHRSRSCRDVCILPAPRPAGAQQACVRAELDCSRECRGSQHGMPTVFTGITFMWAGSLLIIVACEGRLLPELLESIATPAEAAALNQTCLRAQARDKQIARLTREERLGALPLSLANGRRVTVAQLRSFSRVVRSVSLCCIQRLFPGWKSTVPLWHHHDCVQWPQRSAYQLILRKARWNSVNGRAQVIAAGTPEQVAAALEAAEPLREQLLERGVLVVPLPVFQGDSAAASNGSASDMAASSSSSTADDLRCSCDLDTPPVDVTPLSHVHC